MPLSQTQKCASPSGLAWIGKLGSTLIVIEPCRIAIVPSGNLSITSAEKQSLSLQHSGGYQECASEAPGITQKHADTAASKIRLASHRFSMAIPLSNVGGDMQSRYTFAALGW